MEPDHAATLAETVLRYPEAKIVCNAKTVPMIKQFFSFDIDSRAVIVKEGDTLEIGGHTYAFVMAPMVHWPEVMVTFDATDGILFSADAFGTFGAVSGSIMAKDIDFKGRYLDEARRYYTNIVGKYGPQGPRRPQKGRGPRHQDDLPAARLGADRRPDRLVCGQVHRLGQLPAGGKGRP